MIGYVAGEKDDAMTTVDRVQERLIALGETLVTAESCTGGLIAGALTDRAGSSGYFLGGVVVYSNALKVSLLGVREDDLAAFGAVSDVVARAMALGARERLGGDWAIAVTGVAGPGASEAKPAGLVYVAVAGPGGVLVVEEHRFAGDRSEVRARTVVRALGLLLELVGG